MKTTISLVVAAAFALSSATLSARGGPPEPGSLSPHHETGQPGVECGEDEALGSPGHAADAPGSAFNEDGTAHGVYAGEQDVNSKNTASVSQYDTACLFTFH